jgi:8-oxo-dGTP diphosphatase
VQQRYGAKLVGRWQTEDGSRIVALWVYESTEHYEAIQKQVNTDPDSVKAQEFRKRELEPLFIEREENLMVSTVPFSLTELAHLE